MAPRHFGIASSSSPARVCQARRPVADSLRQPLGLALAPRSAPRGPFLRIAAAGRSRAPFRHESIQFLVLEEEPFFAALQCARPDAAWVRFDSNDHYAGHSPYALYASRDGGAHWRGVLSTVGAVLPVHLPAGPGSHPGPFSVIDPDRAFLLSPTPAAEATGAVQISQGSRLRWLPDIPETTLSTISPLSVSFASATRGWVVGTGGAGRAVILATSDGGRHWQSQLPA
jgi:hypothetical protein